MYVMPEFAPTRAALVHVAAHGNKEDFDKACREAIVDLMGGKQPEDHTDEDGGPDEPLVIFFHSFSYAGDLNMIMTPHNGVMIVDLVEEETREIESGPLQGKKVRIPLPFSR